MRTNDLSEVNFSLGLEQWEKLYMKYSASVMNLSFSILNNSYLSEHILRKVFIKAKFYLDYDTDESAAKIWLMIYTITLSLNEKNSGKILNGLNEDIELYNYADFYEKYENNGFINKVFQNLTEKERQIIILFEVNNLKYEEVLKIYSNTSVNVRKTYKNAVNKLINVFQKEFPNVKKSIETTIFNQLKSEMKINDKFFDYNKEVVRHTKQDLSKDENLEIYEISYEKRNKIIRIIVILVILVVIFANFQRIRLFLYNIKVQLFPFTQSVKHSNPSSTVSSYVSSLSSSSESQSSANSQSNNYIYAESFFYTSDRIDEAVQKSGDVLTQPAYIPENLTLENIKITIAENENGETFCTFTELSYVDNTNPLEVQTLEIRRYYDNAVNLPDVTIDYDIITIADATSYQKVLQEQDSTPVAWNIYFEKNGSVLQITAYYVPYGEVINICNNIE